MTTKPVVTCYYNKTIELKPYYKTGHILTVFTAGELNRYVLARCRSKTRRALDRKGLEKDISMYQTLLQKNLDEYARFKLGEDNTITTKYRGKTIMLFAPYSAGETTDEQMLHDLNAMVVHRVKQKTNTMSDVLTRYEMVNQFEYMYLQYDHQPVRSRTRERTLEAHEYENE